MALMPKPFSSPKYYWGDQKGGKKHPKQVRF
jgi:hypothetical protein